AGRQEPHRLRRYRTDGRGCLSERRYGHACGELRTGYPRRPWSGEGTMQKALVRGLTAAVMSMAAATATSAQDAEDWDLLVQPEEQLTVAYTQFDNGLLLAARCQRGVYQVMIGGLPAAP